MMDQEKIGKFIAACRKEKGLTQAALAEQLGITDRAVSKCKRYAFRRENYRHTNI